MATNTYTALRTTTVSTPVTSVTLDLTGITGYTDLILVDNSKTSSASIAYYLTFNGDTTSGLYSTTYMFADGSSTTSARVSGQNFIYTSRANSTNGNGITQIQNYSNNTTFKSTLGRGNDTDYIFNWTGLWRNTAPITSITMNANGNNIATGSTFTLYGVTAAPAWAAKATGGTITYDVGYTYHTFTSSGTFTPSQALSCDYLVVAGGGGGGGGGSTWASVGGGGAGGLRSTVTATGGGGTLESPLSLSATGYTVTIGAGGAGGIGYYSTGLTSGNNSTFASITSTGGGNGSGFSLGGVPAAGNGGSGGGGYIGGSGGSGTSGQGYGGGTGNPYGDPTGNGGGGGGAGSAGGNYGSSYGGNGGSGVAIAALATTTGTGVSSYYAGGGGGGGSSTGGTANGGGAAGGSGQSNGGNATANTGGGAGGASGSSSGGATNGGNGGSGIVIIRYAN